MKELENEEIWKRVEKFIQLGDEDTVRSIADELMNNSTYIDVYLNYEQEINETWKLVESWKNGEFRIQRTN